MTREFLKNMGIDDANIDKILDENSRDIGKEKQKAEQHKADLDTAKKQLADREKGLEELKRSSGDAEAVKKQLEELQTKYTAETEQYKAQLEARDYADAIARGISGKNLKFSSKSAREAFEARLRDKKLELKDGELSGLDDFIKAQKESDPDAFAPDQPAPRIIAGGGGGHGEPPKPISRAAQLAAEHHNSLYGAVKKE